jgi:hypothetical protein
MIYALFCCLGGLLLLLGYLFLYNRAWYRLNDNPPALGTIAGQELKRLAPGLIFWALLGLGFGLIGTYLMVFFNDLPVEQLQIWMVIGGGGGLALGIVWGFVFGISGG